MSTTRVGVSWEGHNGIWEKASVEADWSEFPEVAGRGLDHRNMNTYVTCKLRLRLLDMRFLVGGITPEAFAAEVQALEAIAADLANPEPF